MLKFFILTIASFLSIITNAQTLTWEKIITNDTKPTVYPYYLAIDSEKNMYTCGQFSGTVDFDPTLDILNLTSTSNTNSDIFFAKYDPFGNIVWAKSLGNGEHTLITQIVIDANDNIYICGAFKATLDFDPSSNVNTLTSNGLIDGYFACYDKDGNYIFAKNIGGTSAVAIDDLALDAEGKIIIAGFFDYSADMDPSANISNLNSAGDFDHFFAKYESDGSFIYAKQIGGLSESLDIQIETDLNKNIIIAGNFKNTCDFDPSSSSYELTTDGTYDVFLAKYNTSGNFIWAKIFENPNETHLSTLAINSSGKILLGMGYDGTMDVDPDSPLVNFTSGVASYFFGMYNENGVYQWGKSLGDYILSGSSMTFNTQDEIFITGRFSGSTDFDPGINEFPLSSSGDDDLFISQFSSNGNFINALSRGTSNDSDNGCDITVDDDGNIYVNGFRQIMDPNLHSDGILLKFENVVSAITDNKNTKESPEIFPNPSSGILYIDLKNNDSYKIEFINSLGNSVHTQQVSSINNKIQLVLTKGIYWVNLKNEQSNQTYCRKIVID